SLLEWAGHGRPRNLSELAAHYKTRRRDELPSLARSPAATCLYAARGVIVWALPGHSALSPSPRPTPVGSTSSCPNERTGTTYALARLALRWLHVQLGARHRDDRGGGDRTRHGGRPRPVLAGRGAPADAGRVRARAGALRARRRAARHRRHRRPRVPPGHVRGRTTERTAASAHIPRSEEHTSELQSRENLVCRLLL